MVSQCPKLKRAQSGKDLRNTPMKPQKCCDDKASVSSNGYSMLSSSEDEDEDEDDEDEDEDEDGSVFPHLAEEGSSVNEVSNKTYAAALLAMLKAPRVPIESEPSPAVDLRKLFARHRKFSVPGSWATNDDSDTDED
jgi:hypothetical protein